MLTGSLAIRLIWSLVELLIGGCWFGLLEPLDQEEDFLAREVELFFFRVTAGFALIIFFVDRGDAGLVNAFLAVVDGVSVVWKPE